MRFFFLLLVSLLLTSCLSSESRYSETSASSKVTAISQDVSLEVIDRYIDAAKLLNNNDKNEVRRGISDLRELGSNELPIANELADFAVFRYLDSNESNKDSAEKFASRAREAWRYSVMVPPGSAGNTIDFSALQILPESMDEIVIQWIASRADEINPPFFFEAYRRLVPENLEEGFYWMNVGLARARYEVERCGDPSLGDLPLLWKGIAAGKLDKNNKEKYFPFMVRSMERIVEEWETIVPINMKVWQYCTGNMPFIKENKIPIDAWTEANHNLREKYEKATKKAENRLN